MVVDDTGSTRKMRAGVSIVEEGGSAPLLLNLYWIKRGGEWRIIHADEIETGIEF